jgi:geranylgeranyl pyrophosphate synthase
MSSIAEHVEIVYRIITQNLKFCRATLFPEFATSLEAVLEERRPAVDKPPWLALSVFVCEALGGDLEPAYHAAAALELGRIAAGCLDEWQDQDTDDALWQAIGPAQTVNLAMAMIALSDLSLDRLADLGVDRALVSRLQKEFSLTLLHMSEGQHADLSGDVSLSNYAQVAGAKTGALLRLGCRAGAIVAGASAETVTRYGDFGRNLGILAQAWNDVYGLAGTRGKRDVDHSLTLPILAAMALDGARYEPLSTEGQAGQLYALTQVQLLHQYAAEALARCPAAGRLGLFLNVYSFDHLLQREAPQVPSPGEDDHAT